MAKERFLKESKTLNLDHLIKAIKTLAYYSESFGEWGYAEYWDGNKEEVFYHIEGGPSVADEFLNAV